MNAAALHRTGNRPMLATLWGLTLVALVPFPSLALMLMGAAANLAANGMALYLLCSRSRADRIHGVARLSLQVVILIVGIVALGRSGVSLEGFARYVTQRSL